MSILEKLDLASYRLFSCVQNSVVLSKCLHPRSTVTSVLNETSRLVPIPTNFFFLSRSRPVLIKNVPLRPDKKIFIPIQSRSKKKIVPVPSRVTYYVSIQKFEREVRQKIQINLARWVRTSAVSLQQRG